MKEQFRESSRLGVSAAVYAAKWIIQSSITAWQRNCCSRLQCSPTSRCHVTLPRWKISKISFARCFAFQLEYI